MKKGVLLLGLSLVTLQLSAQLDTLFSEFFAPPTAVTTTNTGTGAQGKLWNDTNNLSISNGFSYHGEADQPPPGPTPQPSRVRFETNDINTSTGYDHIGLEFYHIAKLFNSNGGFLEYSTDGGASWTTMNASNVNYQKKTDESLWESSGNFQHASYNLPKGNNIWRAGSWPVPTNDWWVREFFDISDIALGPNGNGYTNFRLRFSIEFVIPAQPLLPGGRTVGWGWWMDNLVVYGGTNCEVFPPRMRFDYSPTFPCFPIKPEGGLTQNQNDEYRISVSVTDSVLGNHNSNTSTGIDSVTVVFRKRDSNGVGNWQYQNMSLNSANNSEYRTTLQNVLLGDTIEYYYLAADNSCANSTRFPDSLLNQNDPYLRFWPELGLPFKCGSPDCGSLPGTISQFPWLEDFESNDWAAGSTGGNSGNSHRGTFPVQQTGDRYWNVNPLPNQGGYAWSVSTGATGTNFTGPTGNFTTGGSRYLYAEASQGFTNSTTDIITPCIDLTNNTKCMGLEFYYHFFGEDIGELRVDVDTGANTPAWQNGIMTIQGQDQESDSDPWKRAFVGLEQYNGKFIRLRFRSKKTTFKTGNQARGDMAIDDIRIFEPPLVDAEITEVISPVAGECSYTANEDLDLVIRNSACDTLSNVSIQYQLYTNGTAGAVQNLTANISLPAGDTTLVSFADELDLSALNTYDLVVWTNASGDADRDNDTARVDSIVNRSPFNNFPLVMDFEGLPLGSSQTGNNVFVAKTGLDPDFNWAVGERYTETRGTGPRDGHYRSGQYIYTDARNSSGNVASYLETERCLDFSGMSNPTLELYYHMVGNNIDFISVEYNDPATMEVGEWNTISGSNQTPFTQQNEISDYEFYSVDLSQFANSTVRIRLSVHRKNNGEMADVAIDNMRVYDRIANDAGVEFILRNTIPPGALSTKPEIAQIPANTPADQYFATIGNLNPNVRVRNFGTNGISNETVTFSVTPMCGPNAGTPQTYTSQAGASVGAGNATTLDMPNLTLALERGWCEVCAWTSVSGDTYAFNDTVCRFITGNPTIDIPMSTDFEPCDFEETGFFARAGFSQWETGEPDPSSRFYSPQSRGNVWGTNLTDGYFLDNLEEVLRAPALKNFDTVVSATLQFYQNVDMGNDAAGAVEYFDGGWKTLGESLGSFQGVGENWYTNSPMGTLSAEVGNIEQGFTGSSGSPSWRLSSYPMREFNRRGGELRLRFRMDSESGANSQRNREGWAIDDFEVFIPPQNSAAPVNFNFANPLQIPTNDQFFNIRIQNTGAKELDSCLVRVEVWDQGANTQIWAGNDEKVITPQFTIEGARFTYEYQQAWPGNLVTSGPHVIRIITSRPNGKGDNRPLDDTLDTGIDVLPEYFFDVPAGDTAYCNDFEPGTNVLEFLPMNTQTYITGPTSWEKGQPVQFDSAFGGQNAWMTKLDSNYTSRDQSILISPVFVIDPDTNYRVNFMHQFDTEEFHDGGNFEASLDGGLTWQVVGFANEANWYETEFVTALDITKPGWSGVSEGWDSARYVFRFDTAADRVVFRFRFESDFAIQRPGWAIDNFCLSTSGETPNFTIGDEEFNPAPNTFVGTLNPNPTPDVTRIPIYTETPQEIEVRAVNVVGQEVFFKRYQLNEGSNNIELEALDWNAGVYFININIEGTRVTRKLVVQQ